LVVWILYGNDVNPVPCHRSDDDVTAGIRPSNQLLTFDVGIFFVALNATRFSKGSFLRHLICYPDRLTIHATHPPHRTPENSSENPPTRNGAIKDFISFLAVSDFEQGGD